MFHRIPRVVLLVVGLIFAGKTWVHVRSVDEIDSLIGRNSPEMQSSREMVGSLVAVASIMVLEIKYGSFLGRVLKGLIGTTEPTTAKSPAGSRGGKRRRNSIRRIGVSDDQKPANPVIHTEAVSRIEDASSESIRKLS